MAPRYGCIGLASWQGAIGRMSGLERLTVEGYGTSVTSTALFRGKGNSGRVGSASLVFTGADVETARRRMSIKSSRMTVAAEFRDFPRFSRTSAVDVILTFVAAVSVPAERRLLAASAQRPEGRMPIHPHRRISPPGSARPQLTGFDLLHPSNRGRRQPQRQRSVWQAFELVTLVPAARPLVLGINDHAEHADRFR